MVLTASQRYERGVDPAGRGRALDERPGDLCDHGWGQAPACLEVRGSATGGRGVAGGADHGSSGPISAAEVTSAFAR
jgi:hypothetical protein